MELTVTRRGGDVPGKDDVNAAGLPLTTLPAVTRNAWLLWRRALTAAEADGRKVESGWEWRGTLVTLELQEWPAMTTRQADPGYLPAMKARNALRRYLRDSGNLTLLGTGSRYGGKWLIRADFSDAVPDSWTIGTDSARSRRGEMTTSYRCPSCGEDQADRATLDDHRKAAHPVTAPELPGANFYDDILACMGDEPRMPNADLAILLAAGNADAYGDMGGIIQFGKRLTAAGIKYQQLWFGGTTGFAKTGVRRADVVAAKERADDIEAALILRRSKDQAAPAADPASDAKTNRQVLLGALDAILDRNKALERLTKEQAAELDKLRRAPVSQETIDAALEKIVGPLKAERDDLKRRLEAAKKVIGF